MTQAKTTPKAPRQAKPAHASEAKAAEVDKVAKEAAKTRQTRDDGTAEVRWDEEGDGLDLLGQMLAGLTVFELCVECTPHWADLRTRAELQPLWQQVRLLNQLWLRLHKGLVAARSSTPTASQKQDLHVATKVARPMVAKLGKHLPFTPELFKICKKNIEDIEVLRCVRAWREVIHRLTKANRTTPLIDDIEAALTSLPTDAPDLAKRMHLAEAIKRKGRRDLSRIICDSTEARNRTFELTRWSLKWIKSGPEGVEKHYESGMRLERHVPRER